MNLCLWCRSDMLTYDVYICFIIFCCSEYTKRCRDVLAEYQIPVMLQLVKNCQNDLDDGEAGRLVWLCKNATRAHFANRDFAGFLVAVIAAVDLVKFRPEMTAICGQLKGASKFLIMKALKDAK